jgi:hypothetical protein
VDFDYMLACSIVLRKTVDPEAGWELPWKTNAAWPQFYAPAAVRLKGACYASASDDTRLGWCSSSVDSFSADIVLRGTRVCPVCQVH